MSTQIKFTNEMGSTITAQQQGSLSTFNKVTFVSDQLKMIESFDKIKDTSYKQVSYFLDVTEDKYTVLQQLSDVANNVSCIIYLNKQSNNGFELWDFEDYSKTGELRFKGKEVFNDKHWMIFSCSFNPTTNEINEGAIKNYYSNQFDDPNEDRLLQFRYKSDGSLAWIFDCNETFGYIKGITLETFLADTEFSQVDFPWDEHPYYHSVIPYLPVGAL